MPWSRRRPVAGQPWPICISTAAETEAVPPESAISFNSSSPRVLQWTNVVVWSSRPRGAEPLDRARLAELAVTDVAGDREVEVARELPVELGHLVGGELRPAGASDMVISPSFDEKYWSRTRRASSRMRIGVARDDAPLVGSTAMGEDRPRAGVAQPFDRGVGMLRRAQVVRPVEQRGDARVEGFERAEQVAGVGVLGAVVLAERRCGALSGSGRASSRRRCSATAPARCGDGCRSGRASRCIRSRRRSRRRRPRGSGRSRRSCRQPRAHRRSRSRRSWDPSR